MVGSGRGSSGGGSSWGGSNKRRGSNTGPGTEETTIGAATKNALSMVVYMVDGTTTPGAAEVATAETLVERQARLMKKKDDDEG